MNNVIRIPTITVVDDKPENVLNLAKSWEMEHCLVVGHDHEGNLTFGGTTSDLEKILMLLERAKHFSLSEMDD